MTEFNIPAALPTLAAGPHAQGGGKACVMEYVSLLAGEDWTDMPLCTLPVLAVAAQTVNDMALDDERHLLVPLIGRLFGSNGSGKYNQHQVQAMLCRYLADRAERLARVFPLNAGQLSYLHSRVFQAEAVPVLDAATADQVAHLSPEARVRWDREFAPDAVAALTVARTLFSMAHDTGGTGLAVAELSLLLDEYDLVTGRETGPELSSDQLAALTMKLAAASAK